MQKNKLQNEVLAVVLSFPVIGTGDIDDDAGNDDDGRTHLNGKFNAQLNGFRFLGKFYCMSGAQQVSCEQKRTADRAVI